MMLSVERSRVPAVVLLVLMFALQGTPAFLAASATAACPLQNDACCKTLRLTCCDTAPTPSPANVPASAPALRTPALTLAFLPPPVAAVAPAHALLPPARPPWLSNDLPVFLHVLLI